MENQKAIKNSLFNKFLNFTEKAGNALPHPATLFAIFAVAVLILSGLAELFDWQAIHPGTKEIIKPVNLLTVEGLRRILLEMVTNFTSFAPLGIVLVAMLGIGIAESSGLIGAVIRLLVLSAPKHLLTFIIVFSGVLSNTASDVGYVLLIPLAGIIFLSVGRHPLAGMAAAFAGVSGGFSANLLLGTVDPLLAGLSEEAARIIDAAYTVNPTANYYFMVVSTFIISAAGTWVTEKIVEPRLGRYEGDVPQEKIDKLSPAEKKGLLYSLITFAILLIIILFGIIPEGGFLRGADGSILNSPLIKGVVALLLIVAGLGGIAYGIGSGKYKSDGDVVTGMGNAMKTLGLYLVLVFFAAQFVAYFKWTNLGVIFAVQGADVLSSFRFSFVTLMILSIILSIIASMLMGSISAKWKWAVIVPLLIAPFGITLFIPLSSYGLGVIPLTILFIILSAMINMLMGSASAKWALMAPIFIPMFMLMGYSPELTQVVYRIGDSITNIISPMMSFFALIIAFFQKYESKTGIGTIIATMIPYTIVFFFLWTALLIIWILIGLPLGPGAGLYYSF